MESPKEDMKKQIDKITINTRFRNTILYSKTYSIPYSGDTDLLAIC